MKKKAIKPEELYAELIEAIEEGTGIKPVVEYRVYQNMTRTDKGQINFDFAFPEQQIALEVEGGVWTNGGHSRGKGYTEDCMRMNRAVLLGWKVLRITGPQAKSRQGQNYIVELLNVLLWKEAPTT